MPKSESCTLRALNGVLLDGVQEGGVVGLE